MPAIYSDALAALYGTTRSRGREPEQVYIYVEQQCALYGHTSVKGPQITKQINEATDESIKKNHV
jgi:hypothetical protein